VNKKDIQHNEHLQQLLVIHCVQKTPNLAFFNIALEKLGIPQK